MAKEVLLDAFVQIQDSGNTDRDISAQCSSVTIDYSADLQESTAFGDTSRAREGGLKDFSITLDVFLEYGSDLVDDVFFGILGEKKTITIRKDSGAVSATNPEYSGTVLLESYNPIGGTIGEIHSTSITLQGSGALTRSTT